ncbi:MAG: WD40/YVTN/BNR-like repeat-containing protein, partial [Longimicrobiales bacterium]
YVESQYLGLDRVDVETGQRQAIRPGDPTGAIGARRNWNTWGDLEAPDERLGNAMAPANWDGPFLLSPHDPKTIYAGTNILWKSTDQGRSWTSLGDLTTGVDRRTLPIMGRRPTAETLSLDDGIPYYPTLTAIAESPLEAGVLFIGTDDGNVQVSRNDGASWTEVSARMPGLPEHAWINGVEASRFAPGRVYVTANNYRNDDDRNYLYRSDDYGQSWRDLTADLPPNRVLRTLREDPRNPEALYLGSEFGLFYSGTGGEGWTELTGGMPTSAFNDLVIHPRDNDLILGTHGRGIWILDNVNALQELTPEVLSSRIHLFSAEPVEQIRYRSEKGHEGNMIFRGTNPAPGALIDYWLREEGGDVILAILDEHGTQVASVPAEDSRGVNRVVWNLRHTLPGQPGGQPPRGPLVVPGTYSVRLELGEETREIPLVVREDPRLDVDPLVRARWTADLLALAGLGAEVGAGAESMEELLTTVEEREDVPPALESQARELMRQWEELSSRVRRIQGEVEGWVGPLTEQQGSQWAYYREMLETLRGETDTLGTRLRDLGGEGRR